MNTAAIERARAAAKSGYSISEAIFAPGLFFVTRPDGMRYSVENGNCSCPATIACCKHVALVEICNRYVATLARKAVAAPVQPVRARRFYSVKRLQAMRAMAPTMAPLPAPQVQTEVITITTRGRRILSAEEITRRINEDYG